MVPLSSHGVLGSLGLPLGRVQGLGLSGLGLSGLEFRVYSLVEGLGILIC